MNNNELGSTKPLTRRITQRERGFGSVAVGVPVALIELVDEEAAASDRTRTWVIKNILRKYYESQGKLGTRAQEAA